MAAGKSARKVIMKERNTTLETTDHNNRNNSENIKETPDERIPGKLIGAIVAVGSLAFIGILTETVMTVLFPQLMREFNVNTATVQWITTIYLLTVAATMPLSSYLNRKFKHRVLFLAAVALAVLGSLTMIFGHAFPVILVARIIQGIGSGVATPLMMNIILEQSPRSKVGRLMGVGSLVITVAPAIGPTVGGAVSSILPWRAIFVIVIPVIADFAACRPQMHRTAPSDGRGASESAAVRGDCAGVVRSSDVPEPGGRGCCRRRFGWCGYSAGDFRSDQPDRRLGIAFLLRMVVPSFLLAADSLGMAA